MVHARSLAAIHATGRLSSRPSSRTSTQQGDCRVYVVRAVSRFANNIHRTNLFPRPAAALSPAPLLIVPHTRARFRSGGLTTSTVKAQLNAAKSPNRGGSMGCRGGGEMVHVGSPALRNVASATNTYVFLRKASGKHKSVGGGGNGGDGNPDSG